ncbi:N-acetyltransferase family protein [Streptomyces sp. URMC 127]|uniref:GNAT family N-acetyltransferase n=1 Tax=Streptomyces sp. URMC 127 TaxID=3423402 RepID=UPI003F1D4AF7
MTPEGYVIRSARSGDAAFLAEMLAEAVSWRPGRLRPSGDEVLRDERIAHYAAGWPRSGDLGAVAEGPDGSPVGAAWLRVFPSDRPGYGFVAHGVPELTMGVLGLWRGRGVGRALLREALRLAGEAGHGRVSLNVVADNPALALYEEEGFTVVRVRPDGQSMVKVLAPPEAG